MIFADGRAALGDFGASRFAAPVTRAYTEAGTFGYIAPEQAYGRARFASDVFSLGLIAYEILTGFLPTWPFEWPPERYRTLHREGARAGAAGAAQGRAVRSGQALCRWPDLLRSARARVRGGGRARADRAAPPPQAARARPLAARGVGRGVPARARARPRAALPLPPLRRPDRRADGPLPVVRQRGQLVHRTSRAPRSSAPTARRACARSGRRARGVMRVASRATAGARRPTRRRCARAARAAATGQLRPFMRYCPLCKRKVKRVWSHADLPDRCPRCRWPTSHAYFRFCPWCGRREPRAGSFRGR